MYCCCSGERQNEIFFTNSRILIFYELKVLNNEQRRVWVQRKRTKANSRGGSKKTPEFKRAHFLIRLLWKPVPIKLPQNADSAQSQDKSIYFK